VSKRDKAKREKAAKVIEGFKLSLAADVEPVRFVSTGVRSIDRIIGGGLPGGRIVEIYGPFSSGKTLLCQSAIVQVQRVEGFPIYVDREHAFDVKYAERTGVDLKKLYYEKDLKTVEQIFDYVMWAFATLRKENGPDKIIAAFIDSIAQANTGKELGRGVGADEELAPWDKDMGHRAKIIAEALRKVSGVMDDNMILVIVNQTRSKVGVTWGNPETTTGGQALPFASSLRIRLQQGVYKDSKNEKFIYDGNRLVGTRVMVSVPKNKVAAPLRKCEAVMSFDYGFLEYAGLYELLVSEGVIEEGPAKGEFTFNNAKHKKRDFTQLVKDDPQILDSDPRNVMQESGEPEGPEE
jgi:recombination protein RecA